MSLGLWYIFVEACARLCESPIASGANVGDITLGIPKHPFIMTNIFIIRQVIYAGILKSKQAAVWVGLTKPGRIIASLGWHIKAWAGLSLGRTRVK
jgi:hypothetical protein